MSKKNQGYGGNVQSQPDVVRLTQRELDNVLGAATEEVVFLMENCTEAVTADRLQGITTQLAAMLNMDQDKLDQALVQTQKEIDFVIENCSDALVTERLQDVTAVRLTSIRMLSGKKRIAPWRRKELLAILTKQ